MINKENNNLGYITGRLCALVEFLHEACKWEYGRVSNVALVSMQPFAMIQQFNSAQKCLRRMPEYEPIMLEIAEKFNPDEFLPKHLNMADQSAFMMGYYSQKGDLKTYRLQVGNKIAELRKQKGMSQRDLAEAAGVTPANIANIENGKYSVGIDVLAKIAGALEWDFINME